MSLDRGRAARLTVYLHGDSRWGHHAVSDEIIHRAARAGLAGASRFSGIEGYGRNRAIHSDVDPDIVSGLPCEVVVVDPSEERVRGFLPSLYEVLDHGLVLIDTVEVAGVYRPAR